MPVSANFANQFPTTALISEKSEPLKSTADFSSKTELSWVSALTGSVVVGVSFNVCVGVQMRVPVAVVVCFNAMKTMQAI